MPINLAVFDLSSYLPDSLVPQYEALRDAVVSFLETIGIAKGIESASAGEFPIQVIVWSKTHHNPQIPQKPGMHSNKLKTALTSPRKRRSKRIKSLPACLTQNGMARRVNGKSLTASA